MPNTVTATAYPKVLLTSPAGKASIPSWIRGRFSSKIVTSRGVHRLKQLRKLTVVRAEAPKNVLEKKSFLHELALLHSSTPEPAKIVFVFEAKTGPTNANQLLQLLTYFERVSDVEFACGAQQARFAMDEAVAKIWAERRQDREERPVSDPLGKVKQVIASTASLRAESGRLSAQLVADAFGLSLAELASLIETSRQTLWKTPDAESVQPKLFPFERVARLQAIFGPDEFLGWLNMPNAQLGHHPPISLIREGKVSLVADLAEDMLTGSPS